MRSGVAIASLVLALPASAQAATAVSVFPIPGSRAASPQTQIAFRGIPAAQLGAVTVIGSRTGIHSGRIVSDSDGLGGSFLPAAPFRPGESVRVTTSLNIVRGQAGSFSFQVVTPAGGLPFRKFVGAPRVPGDRRRRD